MFDSTPTRPPAPPAPCPPRTRLPTPAAARRDPTATHGSRSIHGSGATHACGAAAGPPAEIWLDGAWLDAAWLTAVWLDAPRPPGGAGRLGRHAGITAGRRLPGVLLQWAPAPSGERLALVRYRPGSDADEELLHYVPARFVTPRAGRRAPAGRPRTPVGPSRPARRVRSRRVGAASAGRSRRVSAVVGDVAAGVADLVAGLTPRLATALLTGLPWRGGLGPDPVWPATPPASRREPVRWPPPPGPPSRARSRRPLPSPAGRG